MLIAALAVALTVNVTVAPGIPSTLVARALAETDAIWRNSGFAFAWRQAPRDHAAETLHVVIGRDVRPVIDGGIALGWIMFDETSPDREIYVSYANAEALLADSPGVIGPLDRTTKFEREVLLGRALGRALAHEMGHYLLASKVHTVKGLMKARRTASDFFGNDNRGFTLDAAQRSAITARLTREAVVASR